MDLTEFDGILGILIAGGMTHQTKVSIADLWSNSPFIPTIFSTVMARTRFKEIMKYLRFDDKREREEKLKVDKIASIREMYELIVERFKSSYHPSACLTIDERISPFKGRVGFKVYMPNKPKKFGIKLWMLCDAENFYVSNFTIYAGKEGGKREVDQGEKVVLNLTQHLNRGHNITTDNFFTSIPLAIKLLRRDNPLTLLGTVRKNRKFIPVHIREHVKEEKEKKKRERRTSGRKSREEEEEHDYPSRFAYTNELQLVSYMYKKDKAIIILSSSSPNTSVSEESKKKPGLILDYNDTKYGVDMLDKMTMDSSFTRATRRWTVNMFYNMLDMICHNALVAYRISKNVKVKKREFLERLVTDLCVPNTSAREPGPKLRKVVKGTISKFVSPSQGSSASSTASTSREDRPGRDERCDLCEGSKRNRNRGTFYCTSCQRKVCRDHQQPIKCINCD